MLIDNRIRVLINTLRVRVRVRVLFREECVCCGWAAKLRETKFLIVD